MNGVCLHGQALYKSKKQKRLSHCCECFIEHGVNGVRSYYRGSIA